MNIFNFFYYTDEEESWNETRLPSWFFGQWKWQSWKLSTLPSGNPPFSEKLDRLKTGACKDLLLFNTFLYRDDVESSRKNSAFDWRSEGSEMLLVVWGVVWLLKLTWCSDWRRSHAGLVMDSLQPALLLLCTMSATEFLLCRMDFCSRWTWGLGGHECAPKTDSTPLLSFNIAFLSLAAFVSFTDCIDDTSCEWFTVLPVFPLLSWLAESSQISSPFPDSICIVLRTVEVAKLGNLKVERHNIASFSRVVNECVPDENFKSSLTFFLFSVKWWFSPFRPKTSGKRSRLLLCCLKKALFFKIISLRAARFLISTSCSVLMRSSSQPTFFSMAFLIFWLSLMLGSWLLFSCAGILLRAKSFKWKWLSWL